MPEAEDLSRIATLPKEEAPIVPESPASEAAPVASAQVEPQTWVRMIALVTSRFGSALDRD